MLRPSINWWLTTWWPGRAMAATAVALRAFEAADAPEITELVNDWRIVRWTSSIPYPYTMQDAVQWLDAMEADDTRCPYAITCEGALAGCVSYWPCDEGGIEVGYWLGTAYWGRGVASSALQQLLALESFPADQRVIAKVMAGNIGSERVLQKCGFRFVAHCALPARGDLVPSVLYRWYGR